MSRPKARPDNPARTARPGVRTKVFVRDDMLGAGKMELLARIGETGSISAAARDMGIGYRRAWFLIETVQRCFAEPVVETRRGGSNAGARLTRFGAELVARYTAFDTDVQSRSAEFRDWLETHQSRPEAPPEDSPEDSPGETAGDTPGGAPQTKA